MTLMDESVKQTAINMDENRTIDISSLNELVEHLSVKHNKLAIVLDYQADLKVSGFVGPIIDLNTYLSQALLNTLGR